MTRYTERESIGYFKTFGLIIRPSNFMVGVKVPASLAAYLASIVVSLKHLSSPLSILRQMVGFISVGKCSIITYTSGSRFASHAFEFLSNPVRICPSYSDSYHSIVVPPLCGAMLRARYVFKWLIRYALPTVSACPISLTEFTQTTSGRKGIKVEAARSASNRIESRCQLASFSCTDSAAMCGLRRFSRELRLTLWAGFNHRGIIPKGV